jgi:hypothetical protein
LKKNVSDSGRTWRDGRRRGSVTTMVKTRVEELVTSELEWSLFFECCCETSAERLRAQAWQFKDELEERSRKFERPRRRFRSLDVENALLELAVELLPDTPAGSQNPREVLLTEAVVWLVTQPVSEEAVRQFFYGAEEIWEQSLGEFREELRERVKHVVRMEHAARMERVTRTAVSERGVLTDAREVLINAQLIQNEQEVFELAKETLGSKSEGEAR